MARSGELLRRGMRTLALGLLVSCGGGGSDGITTPTPSPTPTPTPTPAAVASVSISPSACTINPANTCVLTATTRDASGNVLTGRTVTWTTGSSANATVSSSGVVTAVATGSATITATSEGQVSTASIAVANSASASVTVQVDAAVTGSPIADLWGVNKNPRFAAGFGSGTVFDASPLYPAFGITQVRLHDNSVDVCSIYSPATKLNMNTNPPSEITGCSLAGTGAPGLAGLPWFRWTPTSSADSDLNNTANYDFTNTDIILATTANAGAKVYLRLGDSYIGPNDTVDPVAYAKIATNIYKHVIGQFKTGAVTAEPLFVEIWNEPDGMFWRGPKATFFTLYTEIATRVRAAAAAAGKSVVIGGPGFTSTFLPQTLNATNPANGFVAAVGAGNIDFFSVHHYGSCATATLSAAATYFRGVRTHMDAQGLSGKPMHVTEFNIGLAEHCGSLIYSEQRMQSFVSGLLTLMQDPASNIKAAHMYAGVTIMSLFDFDASPGNARINPSAWAYWAHTKLKGATGISAKVCPGGTNCVNGYAAESQPLLALAGSAGTARTAVITNDGAAAVTYTVRFSGLTGSSVTATIMTPPSGTRDVPVSGSPAKPSAAAVASLLALATSEVRSSLGLVGGGLDITLTIPARSAQVVEIK